MGSYINIEALNTPQRGSYDWKIETEVMTPLFLLFRASSFADANLPMYHFWFQFAGVLPAPRAQTRQPKSPQTPSFQQVPEPVEEDFQQKEIFSLLKEASGHGNQCYGFRDERREEASSVLGIQESACNQDLGSE